MASDPQPNWTKALEQTEQLISFYNNTIKPTLISFYNITHEDFNIQIHEPDNKGYEPCIEYTKGITISYYKFNGDTFPRYSITLSHDANTLTGKTININSNPDIRMVRLLVKHWDKIQSYMNDRVKVCTQEYTDISNIINKHQVSKAN